MHPIHVAAILATVVVYEAFEQWKKLIWLLCSCEEAIGIHHDLYSSFIGDIGNSIAVSIVIILFQVYYIFN